MDYSLYRPQRRYRRLWEVDFDELTRLGYLNLLIDVDNTIARCGITEPETQAAKCIEEILHRNPPFSVCLLSNIVFGRQRQKRVEYIAKTLKVPCVPADFLHQKPGAYAFLQAINILEAKPENCAVIGDQVLTDVLGANRLGLFSILLEPLGKDHWINGLMGTRKKERKILEKIFPAQ